MSSGPCYCCSKIFGLVKFKTHRFSLAGCETLVKSVLSSHSTYHLIVLPLYKWMAKKIDQIHRRILWRGEEPDKICGGHCLVNWPTVCNQRTWGAWVFLISKDLVELSDFDGYGLNGKMMINRGKGCGYHVTRLTEICSMHPL